MLHTVQGIVLRTTDYGEGDKILRLLTREAGKVGVMARGAKKVKSRLGAVTQLFTRGEYVYFKSKGLGTLSSAEIIDAHHGLHEDLMKSAYASYVAEMVDRMLEDGDGSAMLYEQLDAALKAIEEGKDAQIVTRIFELLMLKIAGYAPVLEECSSCRSTAGPFAFSAQLGGILCPRCLYKDAAAVALTEGALKLLRLLAGVDIRRLGTTGVRDETKELLKECMRIYMDTHVGVAWKARGFLDQMEKYAGS